MVAFWVFILALSVLLYVLLDGFDLGIGILFGVAPKESEKRAMMSAVSPVWDGNETWLIVAGVVLWGAFPIVYSTLVSAFYLPIVFMLAGLILRGVAFEFRYKTERWRGVWDVAFAGGSVVATFMQGVTVGALVEGLPMLHGQYTGGDLGWLDPFAILCGVGLCMGYSLLGACWMVRKCEGEARDLGYRLIAPLSVGLLAFLAIVFALALRSHLQVMDRWLDRPYLFVFPAIGALAAIVLAYSVRRRSDGPPFLMASLIFIAAFGTLALSFWPYMIPFQITIKEAAAPQNSLAFMFWGEGIFVFPLMLAYAIFSYAVFRGKVRSDQAYH
ncbi:MAG TPA: cytochrome d ubiquinol oxidase subunit II [Caulobacteraceae bacterium]|jgi:cytochrome d ubiquinol oxidase subunit II|nr:cytochrome d ubiquinol oxidase subunit II [Caulobacteraceae bacterium]